MTHILGVGQPLLLSSFPSYQIPSLSYIQTPLPEQEALPADLPDVDVETLGTKELAYHITMLDWDLFWAIHEYELLYHTFGRHHFGKVGP